MGSIIILSHSFEATIRYQNDDLRAFSLDPLFDPYWRVQISKWTQSEFVYIEPKPHEFSTRPFSFGADHRSTSISFRLDTYSIIKWSLRRPEVVVLHLHFVDKGWQLLYPGVKLDKESISVCLQARKMMTENYLSIEGFFSGADATARAPNIIFQNMQIL